jgi:probable rRNA maturation factor
MSSESGAAGANDLSRQPLILFEKAPRALPRRPLTAFAELVSTRVALGRRFCCLLTGDDELQRLNREFRALDEPTDVLSFPTESPSGELGDIAISIDRAREQADVYGHELSAEVRILLLHGVLHLLGHDHETDRGKMRRLETRWRKEFGLPTGLIERVSEPAAPHSATARGRKR